jgi:hypothetical protein
MFGQEGINFRSLMPLRLVHIEVNAPALEASVKSVKKFQKPFSISLGNREKSVPSPQGFDPAKEVESLSMLTLCRHLDPSPAFHPKTPQPRMKGITCLIPKDQNGPGSSQDGPKFFLRPRRNRGTPLPVAWSNRYPGFFNTNPNLWSQLRACRALIEIPQTFLRYSTTVTPSQRERWSPNFLGSFSMASSSPWAISGVTRGGLPERERSSRLSNPRALASRIQATAVGRLRPKRFPTAVDRHPLNISSKAAIRIPAHAPGIKVARWRSFSSVTSALVIRNGFIAPYYRAITYFCKVIYYH